MSRWGRTDWSSNWFAPAPKLAPPARGIKVKKTGATWWGKRWIEALEALSGSYSNRLPRGRSYARAGRTHDLVVAPGRVTARVTGSRPKPYDVTIVLPALPEATWRKAIAAMAAKAEFSTELLAGAMPKEIDEAFRAAGASLFPKGERELKTDCSCPDWANPCKHIAATHYVLGEALDKDPFLLFELRGRTKEAVLAALRAERGAASPGKQAAKKIVEAPVVASVKLGAISAAEYDRAPSPLPSLSFAFEGPAQSGALLAQLGVPASWQSATSPSELLGPLMRAASATARRIASEERELAMEIDPVSEPARTVPKKAASRRKNAAKQGAAKASSTARKR